MIGEEITMAERIALPEPNVREPRWCCFHRAVGSFLLRKFGQRMSAVRSRTIAYRKRAVVTHCWQLGSEPYEFCRNSRHTFCN